MIYHFKSLVLVRKGRAFYATLYQEVFFANPGGGGSLKEMNIIIIIIYRRKATRTFLYTQKAKNCETFLYPKSQTLFKKRDNFRYVFIYQKLYTLRYGIFHEIFEVGIYIQKA